MTYPLRTEHRAQTTDVWDQQTLRPAPCLPREWEVRRDHSGATGSLNGRFSHVDWPGDEGTLTVLFYVGAVGQAHAIGVWAGGAHRILEIKAASEISFFFDLKFVKSDSFKIQVNMLSRWR